MAEWFETFEKCCWLLNDASGEVDAPFILNALELNPGDRVLDAPCGAGRISAPLARAGCRVTCMDLKPEHIERAKKRFAGEKLDGEFTVCDLRRLDYNGIFDAAINWGGSFGYFSDAENAEVLVRLARALKPGGLLLIDQPNRECVLRNFLSWTAGDTLTLRSSWDAKAQRMETTWIIHDPDGDRKSFSSMRLYTPAQFCQAFERAGLTWETAYGGLDGSPLRRGSRRIYVVTRKQ